MNSIFQVTHIHLVGIKGVAMTSLAQCLLDLGKTVTGSDVEDEFVTTPMLSKVGVQTYVGFSPEHIHESTELVIYSGAHKGSQNPEVLTAISKHIPVLSHADALGALTEGKKCIAVCGVGGKSSVSAMITWILECAGKKPSFSVGVGNVLNLGRTGRYEKDSSYFVVEADEYVKDPGHDNAPRFMSLNPEVIVCTNIAYDHPDVYASFEDTKNAYRSFFAKLPTQGSLVYNGDDVALSTLSDQIQTQKISISKKDGAIFMISNYRASLGKTEADIVYKEKIYTLILQIPGEFNVMNATYAIVAAQACGVDIETSLRALAQFQGTMRRFENKGVKQGVQYYDDYAHHPTEIQATLKALREWHPQAKVYAIFQPHTYSRTKALLKEFSMSFSDANEVLLLDIFASAREEADANTSSDILAQELQNNHIQVQNLHSVQQAFEYLKLEVKPGDVVITLGAGDLYNLHSLC